eukprot:CAMPEP_0181321782 /NCGR_PEP_ID=MMETSP1101-20121128/18880_1 /TAXON_ID=46948 /ORGANISM="Rhodomonas abbreviata, Strain Caron Lab Isolate" /LENGTH=191 /DNA_ID=CAMNT_0023429655 /DNA_START=185 /DNA_END=760 /DNA_ORIENTATION=+
MDFANQSFPVVVRSAHVGQAHVSSFSRAEPRAGGGRATVSLFVASVLHSNAWTIGQVPLPFAALHVSGYLKMEWLCPNGGYFSVTLGTAETSEQGDMEIKFDDNRLRAYGEVTTLSDVSVPSGVRAQEWIRMDVMLKPTERAVDLSVNGQMLQTMPLKGASWTCIKAVVLKGWAKTRCEAPLDNRPLDPEL